MPKVTRIKSKDRGPEKVKDARVVARVSSGKKNKKTEEKVEKKVVAKVSVGEKKGATVKNRDVAAEVAQMKNQKAEERALARKRRQDKKEAKRVRREKKRAERAEKRKNEPKWKKVLLFLPRLIIAPFIALGRYCHDSWIELRQVRWPSRKATWKMFFAILIYVGILMAFVMGLDALFTWLFNFVIGK